MLGCGALLVILAGLCGVGVFLGKRLADTVLGPIQAQADAFGRGDEAAVCRHNSAALQAQLPCPSYVLWLRQHTPYFAGATLSPAGFTSANYTSEQQSVAISVQARGPHGTGRMTFYMTQHGGVWQVERVEPY